MHMVFCIYSSQTFIIANIYCMMFLFFVFLNLYISDFGCVVFFIIIVYTFSIALL